MTRVFLVLLALSGTLTRAQPTFDVGGFTRALPEPGVSAEVCGDCHATQRAEWERSSHRASLTNRWFLDGFSAEPHQRCITCHAPLEVQGRAAWRARSALARGDSSRLPASSLGHEGITCVVCHVRGGVVQAAHADALPYSHPLAYAPQLHSGEVCRACHDFQGHAVREGVTVLNEFPVQTTAREWDAWGGAETCVSCHFPSGSHALASAHDPEVLRRAVTLELADGEARVQSVGVGHRFPSGDVFRHLVLWVDGRPVRRFGLTLESSVDRNGVEGLAVKEDTRLQPGEVAHVPLPKTAKVVQLSYHFTPVSPRARVGLTREDEVLMLWTRSVLRVR